MVETLCCSKCGAEMPAGTQQGLCPACLLKIGLERSAFGPDTVASTSSSAEPFAATVDYQPGVIPEHTGELFLREGQQFGRYRILRLIGKGGMGNVYEAEQLDTGRRVALKALKHSLDSAEARKRFLREGRLAASINHPNSVYVFGTEEISGTLVITMELVAGGTLQDRVKRQGPLPTAEAVDAILQIIAGLEAAQSIGILHRDVKPANCFTELDGTVKIGDFGLSISTGPRGDFDITQSGSFLGTPAFASPEQLRGEELNIRSDIYSVGVTLYYLLTARTPFPADNMIQLLATVLERPAESPQRWRPEVPSGLASVVLRCLDKQPTERFVSYDELRQALFPYSSTVPAPATLSERLAAYAVDWILLWATIALLLWSLRWLANVHVDSGWGFFLASETVWLLYFTVTEGLWGASLGKAMVGLRVAGKHRGPPGVFKAAARVLVLTMLPLLLTMTAEWFIPLLNGADALVRVWFFLLLFCTAMRRNGYPAIYDLLTNTRVIHRPAYQARPGLQPTEEALPATQAVTIGPFHVLDVLEAGEQESWILGYDMRLLRRVWIRKMPPDAPSVDRQLRNVARHGRLRWLQGQRSIRECWDAYEAPAGQPLLKLLVNRQPWSSVRFWLLDLAEELVASAQDGSWPKVLALDHVWITSDGRAKLFDFPAPGIDPLARRTNALPPAATAQQFLNQLASSALEGQEVSATEAATHVAAAPVPVPAHNMLAELPRIQDPSVIVQPLRSLVLQIPLVSRKKRVGLLVAGPLLVSFFTVLFLFIPLAYGYRGIEHPGNRLLLTLIVAFGLLCFVGLVSVLGAATLRQGLLWSEFGIVAVTATGSRASRLRLLGRSLTTWSPVFLAGIVMAVVCDAVETPLIPALTISAVSLVVAAIVGVAPIVLWPSLPERSLADRLSGTWLVPQ